MDHPAERLAAGRRMPRIPAVAEGQVEPTSSALVVLGGDIHPTIPGRLPQVNNTREDPENGRGR